MIIIRKVPNEALIEGICFHPGAQFIRDDRFFAVLKENKAFNDQVEAEFMEIVVPAEDPKEAKGKPKRDCLAEVIASLPEKKAISIIKRTLDGVDLKEISKLEKRREVVEAAEKQIAERSAYIGGMLPPPQAAIKSPLSIGEHE